MMKPFDRSQKSRQQIVPDRSDAPLLETKGVCAGYSAQDVLHRVDFQVNQGEVVAVIGHNGAGKTTLLKVIFGLLKPRSGEVLVEGRPMAKPGPLEMVRRGLSLTPEGRGVFPSLSVTENLDLGAHGVSNWQEIKRRADMVFDLFPDLRDREGQRVGSMSGGQQQMVAIGISLMKLPRLLLLDEPSIGLAPVLVEKVLHSVVKINQQLGTSVVIVEQNVEQVLRIADRAYLLNTGKVVATDTPDRLRDGHLLWKLF